MSRQTDFEEQNEDFWRSQEGLLSNDQGGPQLPQNYRRMCRQLNLARQRHYDGRLITRLEKIVLAQYALLYRPPSTLLKRCGRYLMLDFPRRVREEWRLVSFSFILFFLPLIVMTWIFATNPDAHEYILSSSQQASLDASWSKSHDQSFDDRFYMWAHYVMNNVSIDFMCFAGGLVFGIGSIYFMLFNGIYIGAVAGYVTYAGHGERFWAFVAGHSAPELLAAVIAGAAGMRLGMGLLKPGGLPRSQALRSSCGEAMQLLYGAAFLTFSAAFLEAFWSGFNFEMRMPKYIVGGVIWILMLAWFIFAGREFKRRET